MIGSRREEAAHYAVNEVGVTYDASTSQTTDDPAVAYADRRREPRRPAPNPGRFADADEAAGGLAQL
jgi:hypothetical protein